MTTKDMLGRDNIMTAEKALGLLLSAMSERQTPPEVVDVDDSPGRICAEDIIPDEDLPPFARSAVDGYAVKAADTFSASDTMPAYLNLTGEVFMGRAADMLLTAGGVVKIPTGGMLPEGADAVVMFEHVQVVDRTMIEVMKPVGPGENVIQRGEDIRKGDLLIGKGHRLRPQDIGACAGIGRTLISVHKKPVVSIISTGDEVVPASSSPGPGQVRDINSHFLGSLVSEAGGSAVIKGIFRDEYSAIRGVIEESMKSSDMVLVSGGTSVGTKDMLSGIISDIGGPGLLFHGVSLKPGKPLIGGIIQGVPIFGLPGHPAAVSICFELFILQLLGRLCGLKERYAGLRKPVVPARLAKNISSVMGREEHVRVKLEEREDGLWAMPIIGKSGLVSTMVRSDGTLVIPVNKNGVQQGELVEVRLFR